MALVPSSLPAIEPVSLAEAKLHLRVDHDDEDILILSLISAARLHLEHVLGRAFITQGWLYLLDGWPSGHTLELPLSPVQSIVSVKVYDETDVAETVAPSLYLLDGLSQPPRLVRRSSSAFPRPGRSANGVEVSFVAGHGSLASEVPAPLRQALMLLVAHWYEHRQPVEIGDAKEVLPAIVTELIAPYRRRGL
ncbi:MAG: head-tail connector protein [Hyphomicrobiaceae bacterium]